MQSVVQQFEMNGRSNGEELSPPCSDQDEHQSASLNGTALSEQLLIVQPADNEHLETIPEQEEIAKGKDTNLPHYQNFEVVDDSDKVLGYCKLVANRPSLTFGKLNVVTIKY